VCVGAALAVVIMNDLFRAALCLILCFFCVAGLYATLNADLLAGLQVLVYVGAIALLILFAIMMTKNVQEGNSFNKMAIPMGIVAIILMGAMIASVVDEDDFASLSANEARNMLGEDVVVEEDQPTTRGIGKLMFTEDNGYLLVFEVGAVLLLASVIGAMVLVREREK